MEHASPVAVGIIIIFHSCITYTSDVYISAYTFHPSWHMYKCSNLALSTRQQCRRLTDVACFTRFSRVVWQPVARAKLRFKHKMLSKRIKLKTPLCNTWQQFNTIKISPPCPKNENFKYRGTSQETDSGWNCPNSFSEQSQLWGSVERKRVGIKIFYLFFSDAFGRGEAPQNRLFPNWSTRFQMSCLHFQMQFQLSLQEYMAYSTNATDSRKLFHTLSFPHGASI